MNKFPTTFADSLEALPSGQLGEAGEAAIARLVEKGYEVQLGLTADYAQAINAMALELAIREYCPNDAGQRFADVDATQQWLSQGRGVFLLLHKGETGAKRLAGYGWIGVKPHALVPGGETTFGIRISEADQGKGLAAPYARVMVAGAAALYGCRSMWLETWQSNGGAVHVYQKIGFEIVTEKPAMRPSVIENGEVADTRLFMKFPNDLLP